MSEGLSALFDARLRRIEKLEEMVGRLENYRRNVNLLINRAQMQLGATHPAYWILDDLDDSYFEEKPDGYFEDWRPGA